MSQQEHNKGPHHNGHLYSSHAHGHVPVHAHVPGHGHGHPAHHGRHGHAAPPADSDSAKLAAAIEAYKKQKAEIERRFARMGGTANDIYKMMARNLQNQKED